MVRAKKPSPPPDNFKIIQCSKINNFNLISFFISATLNQMQTEHSVEGEYERVTINSTIALASSKLLCTGELMV